MLLKLNINVQENSKSSSRLVVAERWHCSCLSPVCPCAPILQLQVHFSLGCSSRTIPCIHKSRRMFYFAQYDPILCILHLYHHIKCGFGMTCLVTGKCYLTHHGLVPYLTTLAALFLSSAADIAGFYTKGRPLVKSNLFCPSDKLS